MKLENSRHYYNLINKILANKKFKIDGLEIATERIFSYYQYENLLKKLGFKSPTCTMYILIRDCDDINKIVNIISDFIKMGPEISMIVKDYENATLNYSLELVYKYLSDEYFEKRKIKWSEIYNYDKKFVQYVNSLYMQSGVYFIFNYQKELIYIGKSKNLSDRIFTSVSERIKYDPGYISVLKTDSICDANILEPFFISKLKPIANTEFNDCGDTKLEISIDGEKINYINILNFEKVKIFAKKDENKQENQR